LIHLFLFEHRQCVTEPTGASPIHFTSTTFLYIIEKFVITIITQGIIRFFLLSVSFNGSD
jgi:hypothetical protein